ncbi:hypothetical protein [Kitasatospora sp. HPMI-4]|uniref:hypothetical protein n=1 Tax=Kitasatospora sp. HPMI-4 TaxID=3448443 RepID=UPI003F1AE424
MTASPATLPHADAALAALAAAGLTAALGQAPAGADPPYCVLYPDPGRAVPGSLADPLAFYEALMQITCVGQSAEQALSVSDRVRTALSVPLAVAGRSGMRPEELGGPLVQRDDDVSPPLFYVPVQYRIRSTP